MFPQKKQSVEEAKVGIEIGSSLLNPTNCRSSFRIHVVRQASAAAFRGRTRPPTVARDFDILAIASDKFTGTERPTS